MIARALVVVAWALALAIVWVPDLPAGRDIPAHAVAAAVWANPAAFSDWLVPNVPLSGTVYPFTAGLIARIVGVLVALKIVLTFSLVVCGLGLGRLTRVCGGEAGLGSVVGLLIATGWLYGMGFVSFVIGTGLALLAASFMFQERPRLAVTAGLFLVAVWCHLMASGIVFGAALFVRLLTMRSASIVRWVVPWIPGLALAFTVGAGYVLGQSGAGASTASEWGTLSSWLRDLALTSLTSFDRTAGLPFGVAAAVASLTLSVAAWRRPMAGTGDAFLRATVVWWLLLIVVPLNGLGWAFARPRLMPMAVLVPLAFSRNRSVVIVGIASLSLTGTLLGAVERGGQVGSIASSLDVDGPSGETFLASYLDLADPADGPYVQPFVGVASYALLDGGVARHLFAHNAAAHSMLYWEGLDLPLATPEFIHVPAACVADPSCSGGPNARAERLALAGIGWDSLAVVGLEGEERTWLEARGYEAVAPSVLQLRPSTLRVSASVAPDLAEFPLVVRWGYPSTGVVGAVVGRAVDGRIEVDVSPLLAGPTVVEIFFDRDENGEPSGADAALFDSPRLNVELVMGETTVLGEE